MSGLDTTASFPGGSYESKESLSRADTHEDVTPNEIAVGVIDQLLGLNLPAQPLTRLQEAQP